jgi:predicted Zn-dependent protease
LVPETAKLIKQSCLLCLAAMLLLLAGCASVKTQPAANVTTPDSTTQGETPQPAIPGQAGEGIIVEPVPKPIESTNNAVIALLDRSRLDLGAGQREAAGASLERALRIEPRNPWLWYELAQLRLAQGQYAQAVSLSHKSISFSGRDKSLQALNWRLVGNARIAQGNPTGAEQALMRATELEK